MNAALERTRNRSCRRADPELCPRSIRSDLSHTHARFLRVRVHRALPNDACKTPPKRCKKTLPARSDELLLPFFRRRVLGRRRRAGAGAQAGSAERVELREIDLRELARRPPPLPPVGAIAGLAVGLPALLACAAAATWLALAARRKRQAASRKFTKVDVSVLLHMHSFGGGDAASGRGPSSPPPPAAVPPKEWEEKYV